MLFRFFSVISFIFLTTSSSAHDIPEGLPSDLADEYRRLTSELALEQARLEVLNARQANANLERQIGMALQQAAEARRDAERAIAEGELAARRFPDIVVNSAYIFRVHDNDVLCDATNFLRYQCHQGGPAGESLPHSCSFDVTAESRICLLPADRDEPMMLEVQFSCGTDQRDNLFRFGEAATITCR